MTRQTIFLARLLGLYLLIIGLSMLIEARSNYDYAIAALLGDPPIALVLSLATVIAGLAMVLAHNLWRGGALPVVVTLVGWAILAKGLLSLLVPGLMDQGFYFYQMHFVRLYYVYAILWLLLGAYLTYGGFSSRTHA